jgi:predicted RNA-binding protein YlxR (DUF448 family)
MPNKNSNAGHIPFRTCIICKKRVDQKLLLSFYILNKEIVFDINRLVQFRKKYVCHQAECLTLLNKWLGKQLKKTGSVKSPGAS